MKYIELILETMNENTEGAGQILLDTISGILLRKDVQLLTKSQYLALLDEFKQEYSD
jgi:hypothetical protein